MADILDISELLIAKFCHDLAGPVGAINNGVELLKDPMPNLHNESIDLIEISAKETVARLLYFRNAYGINKNPAGISMSSIKELVTNFYTQKNLTFHWPEAHGDSDSMKLIKPDMSKLILNLILIISGTLIYGGNVTTRLKTQKNDCAIKVRGEGKLVKLNDYLTKPFESDFKDSEIDAKNVQAYLITLLARRIDCKVKLESGESYVEILVS